MLHKALLVLALVAVALAASVDHVIAGDFTSVDAVLSSGIAAFASSGSNLKNAGVDEGSYPNGQFVSLSNVASSFVSSSAVLSFAQDGTAVGINAAGVTANSELLYFDNGTSQFLSRLFGFNGYFGFDNGAGPSTQPNIRTASSYVGAVQNVAFLGSTPGRQLVVCMGTNGVFNRLLVGNTTLPNPSTQSPTPTNLKNQLLLFSEGSGSSFINAGFQVNTPATATPLDITPLYTPPTGPVQPNAQPGVDCTSLIGSGTTVLIRTAGGPYYMTSNVGGVSSTTWTPITRDPAKAPGIPLAPGIPGGITNSVYILNGNVGTGGSTSIFWYGGNPSDATLTATDAIPTVYQYSSGAQWTVVIPTAIAKNISFTQFVVGPGGASQIYFTLAPAANPQSVPAPLDDIHMPVEKYVFLGSSSGVNYIAPLYLLTRSATMFLYWDFNVDALIVYASDLSAAVIGNQITYAVPADDRRYFSKALTYAAQYDLTNDRWVQAYGGGFDGPISDIYACTNGVTYITGTFDYAFQTFTGPISRFDTTNGVWSYFNGAKFQQVDIDGGDYHGMLNAPATVYDLAPYTYHGNAGYLVAGQFRTADDGTTPCNSICFFPASNGAKSAFFDAPSTFYNNSGVRFSDPSAATAVIPEHTDNVPGVITNIAIDATGSIYVGGSFNIAGGKAAQNFAIFTPGCSSANGCWDNADGGVNGAVNAMIYLNGNIYIGGSFTQVGASLAAYNVAGYNTKTDTWFTLNRGLDGAVYDFANFNGKLLAVGSFTSGSGQTLRYTATWDGSKWSPLTTNYHLPSQDCLISYCYASDIFLSATGVQDVFMAGSTPFMLLQLTSGYQLIKFVDSSTGFVSVDGGESRENVPTFTSSVPSYGFINSMISTSPYGNGRLDLWNIEGGGTLQTRHVSTYNPSYKNFENIAGTGINNYVYRALPESGPAVAGGGAVTIAASFFMLIASLVLLLL